MAAERKSRRLFLALWPDEPVRVALARDLLGSLVQRGFTPDLKPWRVHMTLARKVVNPRRHGAIEPVEWNVEGFVLVESETLPEGPRYRVLERWPL